MLEYEFYDFLQVKMGGFPVGIVLLWDFNRGKSGIRLLLFEELRFSTGEKREGITVVPEKTRGQKGIFRCEYTYRNIFYSKM